MNCEQYQEKISQFVDGELPPAEENDLFTHLSTCENCRKFLKDVIALDNTISSTRQITVPASLDRKVLEGRLLTTKKISDGIFAGLFKESRYSFRTIGLAIIFSALIGGTISTLWYKSNNAQQTIVCFTPLPEVEVNGYVVVAPSQTKGVKQ